MLIICAVVLTSLIATYVVVRFAPRQRAADSPQVPGRDPWRSTVPRLGGVAVFLAVAVGAALLYRTGLPAEGGGAVPASHFLGLVVGAVIVTAAGTVDDLFYLSPRAKLLAQAAAATAACVLGGCPTEIGLGPDLTVSLGRLAAPLTVLWIVTVINAFNFIDGLDGLAGGLAVVLFSAIGLLAAHADRPALGLVSVVVVGAVIGFLPFNRCPARLYLGDSGSMLLGFLLAVLSLDVARTGESGTTLLAPVPLLLTALPLADICLSVMRRWCRGVRFTLGDRRHLHHRVLALGWGETATVVLLLALAAALAGAAVLTHVVVDNPIGVVVVSAAAGVLLYAAVSAMGYYELSAMYEARGVLAGQGYRAWRAVTQAHIAALDRAHERSEAAMLTLPLRRPASAMPADAADVMREVEAA